MTFQLVAGHPALDLVNTLDWRFRKDGPEELLKSYQDLLRFMEQSKLLTSQQARRLLRWSSVRAGARTLECCRELREAIAEMLYAQLGRNYTTAPLRTLERYFKAARLQQKLGWKQPGLEWRWPETLGAELPLGVLAQSASDLMISENAPRVRACDNPECRWLFLDTSKNHTRRWCDMKVCGNRMKARRFKAQRKA
jgi:predicted RNA-binding Zn ribbon-like protein